jgi:hypothetical protein
MIDFHKLSKTPGEEILFRLKEKVYEKYEYILHIFRKDILSEEKWCKNKCYVKEGKGNDDLLHKSFWRNNRSQFFTESYERIKRLAFIKKHLDYYELISEADNILDGKLELLGRDIRLNENEDWNTDPINGFHWPKVFYASVRKDNNTKQHDIKYVWEINRHQYLIILAKAYWITGNEKYAEKVFDLIQDWISKNPYNSGVNWTSSLELAVRSISWIWAYFFCHSSKYITQKVHTMFAKSIYEHGLYIKKHLSYYSSPYNHLIGEASALHIIGSLFSQFKEAEEWENLGWKILESKVTMQFHDDGMSVEQATFYHHFTLGFYVQSFLLRKLNKKAISKKILSRLEKAFEISMYLTKPDGNIPMIGDVDNARSVYFSSRHSWNFSGLLGIGAALFNRSDFKKQSKGISEEMLWLCDDKMIEKFLNMEETEPEEASKPFFKSGYFICRDSWEDDSHYLGFDCGEIADGLNDKSIPSAAHGHADALSFELSAYGKSFIVDGGFYTYFGDLEWHKHFRQEEAHNTIRIGHYRQAEYCGRLTWKCVKQPELLKWDYNPHYCFVTGKIDYEDGIYCEREALYLRKSFWLFNDYVFVRDKDMEVKSYLHFDPGTDLIIDKKNNMIIAKTGNVGILLHYFADSRVTASRGGSMPADGWVAKGYGIKKPAWQLQFSWTATKNNVLFPVLIIPWKERHDSIQFNETIWSSESETLFKTNLSINEDCYKVSIGRERNIKICSNKKELNIE